MLEFILSSEFVGVFLAIITGVCLLGVARLRNGTTLFRSMIIEFSKWNPREQDFSTFSNYKKSVYDFSVTSSTKTCGMWSSFLDDVQMGVDQDGNQVVECASESVDKLRDNLVFAYATSHRMSRLNGSVLAGLGFIGTLLMICAATLSAEPFLSGDAKLDLALSVLLSGGGLAFICAVGGIICSLAFSAFERSEMTQAESYVDNLISALRSQIHFRTERHYLATISSQMQQSSHSFIKFAKDIGDKVVDLKDNQLNASVLEESNRETAREITGALETTSARVVEAIQETHEKAQRLREESVSSLSQLGDIAVRNEKWWETSIEAMRESSKIQAEWSEKHFEALGRIESELSSSSTREEKILDVLEGIKKGIEDLDEGIEEDVDHLVEQNKETQTALMHYLNDTLEHQLANIAERLKNSDELGDTRAAVMTQTLEKALDGVRQAVENHTETEGDYIRNVRTSLEMGITTVRNAIEKSSSDRNESNRKLVEMLQSANAEHARELEQLRGIEKERLQRESLRDARDREYWERQIKLHEEETQIERRILEEQELARKEVKEHAERSAKDKATYLEKLAKLREGKVSVDFGDDEQTELIYSKVPQQSEAIVSSTVPNNTEILKSLRASRESLENASKNFGIVGEQSDFLTGTCQGILRELNKMNEDILDQTEMRLNRYGKAYQPLAESNLLICELVTRGIKDVGNFKRAVDFDYEKITDQLLQPISRIRNLETSFSNRDELANFDQSQIVKIEQWWSRESGTEEIESYVIDLKSDVASSVKSYLSAQEIASELRNRVDTLKKLVENNILDQVTNWPAVLDEARAVRELARKLASNDKKIGLSSKRSDEKFAHALKKFNEVLDKSETVLLNSNAKETRTTRGKRKEG